MADKKERLRTAATDLWGDSWTIRELEYADGSTDLMAYHSQGLVDHGGERVLERERLLFDTDGDLVRDRVRLTKQQQVDHELLDTAPE